MSFYRIDYHNEAPDSIKVPMYIIMKSSRTNLHWHA